MIDLKPASEQMTELVSGIANEELAAPTPCVEYTVGDLIDHVDLVVQAATALALGGELPDAAFSHLEPDWQDTVVQHLRALGKAWDDPAAWEGTGNVAGSKSSHTTRRRTSRSDSASRGEADLPLGAGGGYVRGILSFEHLPRCGRRQFPKPLFALDGAALM